MTAPSSDHACCAPGAEHGAVPVDVPSAGSSARSSAGSSARSSARSASAPPSAADGAVRDPPAVRVLLPGGEFVMGHDDDDGYPADGEGPAHVVRVRPFRLDATAVSNARFAAFVRATGHRTSAESAGWSFVFAGLLPDGFPPTRGVAAAPWWRQVEGARWDRPEGPASHVADRADHPVVHVSWQDAVAFAAWDSARLPTEAEWEYAARGGLTGAHYPWGAEREPGGEHRMNVWQGRFPTSNTAADGYVGTAPVDAYRPNALGMANMTGNVWEWCADWFSPHAYATAAPLDPRGPARGVRRVLRGGSYLCHASYCFRYRVDARSASTPDSTTGNVGFRCAADA